MGLRLVCGLAFGLGDTLKTKSRGTLKTKERSMGYTTEGIGYQNRETSLQAAVSNKTGKITLRDRVYNLLAESDSALSTEQIAAELGNPYVSVQPRLSELSNDLKVRDSGKRGKTQWGKSCILWEIVN